MFLEARDLCFFVTESLPVRTKLDMCSINISLRQLEGRKVFGEILHKEKITKHAGFNQNTEGIGLLNTFISTLIFDYCDIYKFVCLFLNTNKLCVPTGKR